MSTNKEHFLPVNPNFLLSLYIKDLRIKARMLATRMATKAPVGRVFFILLEA